MIELSRLNGTVLFVNPDLILTVEANPDTVVTLTNHDKLVVRESPAEIRARFIAFRQEVTQSGRLIAGESIG